MTMVLEVISRTQTPLELRVGLLVLLLVFFAMYALSPSWIGSNWILATLPIQRFKWKSETLLSSAANRSGSMISSALVLSLFVFGHFYSSQLHIVPQFPFRFIELYVFVLLLFVFKMYAMKLFFSMHEQADLGAMVIDYHYGYNQIVSLVIGLALSVDIFIVRLQGDYFIILAAIVALVYVFRLLGNIILLMNKFDYSIISLFIYLCTFEIAPMLVVAKVLFENS